MQTGKQIYGNKCKELDSWTDGQVGEQSGRQADHINKQFNLINQIFK